MNTIKEKTNNSFLIFSWALYDLANQFFALNVVSLYFPRWLTLEKKSSEIFYSLAFGISMFMVAASAPFLGAIADKQNRHKTFLIFFTILSVIFTMLLGTSSNLFLSLIFFAIANFGCQEAIIFYNSLMTKIAPRNKIGLVSGIGRTFGYSGAILALYLTRPVILQRGYQSCFLVTGILFLIFSLPCMIFIKESRAAYKTNLSPSLWKEYLSQSFRQLKATIVEWNSFKELKAFFKAVFFGLCAIHTVILFMAVYAGKAFGLTEAQLINLIAFSTIFAILGSILSGFISDLIGYKKSLIGVFLLWIIGLFAGSILHQPFHWIVGILAGISIGSTWVVLRAVVVKLVPEDKIGEAFGLFNLVAYVSGIIGPVFWGLLLLYFGRLGAAGYRISFFSLTLFFITGIIFLLKMNKKSSF